MKKVVFNTNPDIIKIEDISNDSIVGIQWLSGIRTMVMKRNKNDYIGASDNNIQCSWSGESVKDYVMKAKSKGAEAYVFSNVKELFKWMSESEYEG